MALGQIEKQYGKGAIMRLGEHGNVGVAAIPTGALALDLALGIGGLPRGRVVEIFGPRREVHARDARGGRGSAGGCALSTRSTPGPCIQAPRRASAACWSQPDTGEQALDISEMLIASNSVDVIVIDSVAALTPKAELEGDIGDTHVGLQPGS
jgi:recombination protein RecA